ncbi:sensor histidine kinase [Spirillospora sp. NPDC047279]|uniref:sensor histidine kinase n=1 Tax=Spirillospora sp. NPDC047279 TaxID=3155478 RepID=UPI0033D1B9E1
MTVMTRLFAHTGSDAGAGDMDKAERLRRAFWVSFGLLYLIPVAVAVAHYSGTRRVLGAAGLAAFVVTYLAVSLSRHWGAPITPVTWLLFGIFATLAIGLPPAFGEDLMGMPIYLAVVCAMVLPFRWAPVGVVAAALVPVAQAQTFDVGRWAPVVIGVSAFSFGMMMLAFRHSRMLVHQLQEARAEVARLAATEERLRIARDLHDLLGHSLTLIVLKSELARRVADRDPERTLGEIGDIESVARQALTDVRATVSGYRRRDLAEELDAARAALPSAGVEPEIRVSGVPLPDEIDALLAWAVREGVTNVVRHSQAGRCAITLSRDPGGAAVLEMLDDGPVTAAHRPGNGLTGLTERFASAGGTLTAEAVPGTGFRLTARVPVAEEADAEIRRLDRPAPGRAQ